MSKRERDSVSLYLQKQIGYQEKQDIKQKTKQYGGEVVLYSKPKEVMSMNIYDKSTKKEKGKTRKKQTSEETWLNLEVKSLVTALLICPPGSDPLHETALLLHNIRTA